MICWGYDDTAAVASGGVGSLERKREVIPSRITHKPINHLRGKKKERKEER